MVEVETSEKYTVEWCNAQPKFRPGISLLCWAYNEELLIEDYLRRANAMLERHAEDYEIVVVDDCSTDRTNEVVQGLIKEMPQIRLLRNETNRNVGYSSQRAIKSAGKEFLFWQTIDWSYDITLLRAFLHLLETHDVVAGVRRAPVQVVDHFWFIKPVRVILSLFGIKHITRRSDTIRKAFVSIINYCLVRFLFGVPLSDFQNVVFYSSKLVQSIDYESDSSFSNPEGLLKAHWKGASIVEVPISFLPRQKGVAKGTRLSAIFSSITDILRLWFRWVVLGKREYSGKGTIRRLIPDEWESASGDQSEG